MYNLQLTPEQLEFRDTVRDFVENEIKPVALHPDRLQPFEKPLLAALVEKAAQMGLRTFALSEEAGGAGADGLTSCIVLEELAAGDIDIATVLGHTSFLGHVLFDRLLSAEQRARFLPKFAEDDHYHLAFAGRDPGAGAGWSYHRALAAEGGAQLSAKKQSNGDWVINGSLPFVANAPVAKLLAVQVRSDPKKTGINGMSTLLVPRDAAGLTVGEAPKATGEAIRWHQGTGAPVTFKDCRVPADHLVGKEGQSPLADGTLLAISVSQMAAINLGLGRAAYDAAVDYAKIRRQGGRNIIEHQAIGTKLADCAIKLELARNMIWKAAWAADHPEAVADRSVPELPLHTIARVYTAEAVNEVTLLSAECFGAMGVMRDMPLQKYVHDGFVFAHAEETDGAAKLGIAEAVAGFQRPLAA
ncbi:MAG: acyl-CoA dehydrogenase family protein [Betaproteobacteria bacterium]|nr:acyl-CoA dehydrogenase family protein [Betaproteobacteria bacterium]MDH3437429.1 acyl-CoA dehydrogenase family protein [Betaproteobacteria bacterium]